MNTTEAPQGPAPRIEYGRFTSRMIASTLDLGLILLIALPLVQIAMWYTFRPIDLSNASIVKDAYDRHDIPLFYTELWRLVREQHLIQRAVVQNLLQVAFVAIYVLPFWFRFSATPGKMLMGLKIRDVKTGELMTRKQCVGRFLGYIISGLPLSLGFIWILFNKKRRGFHDFLAGTVVVVKPKKYRFL